MLVERLICNQKVNGSRPLPGSISEDVMKEREKKFEELIAITAKHLPIANQKMAEVNSAGKYHPALLKVSEVQDSGVFV